ncbi:hypothetical protein CVO96_00815 [Deinococcus koreensis]|uniref:Galactose oxidase n=1 Tax=Deinococcus koreensis TaxID=2054903 RepID=A0A2K3V1X9_9DEIO|nr:hypothetical protein CVO96_00815 [Deinococcus koreensis]
MNRPLVRNFTTRVQDGRLDLDFIRRVENAKLSALEILPVGTGGTVPPPPAPAPLAWTPRAAAPSTLYEGQGAALGARLYVFGGYDRNLNGRPIATRAARTYDPATDRWAALPDVPEFLTHAGVAVDGTALYLAGGFLGDHPGPHTDHVWKFDTSANTWTAMAPLPGGRAGGALVRLGRDLHYFGGTQRSGGRYLQDFGDHWTLNLDSPAGWRPAAPLPNPRNHLGGVELGGRLYAIGGQHLGNEASGNQTDVHVYTPATDSWRAVSPLPLPLGHITSSTLVWRGRIVVVGGVTQGSGNGGIEGRELETVLSYDPATDRWTVLTPLPGPRQSSVADTIGDALVVTTGSTSAGPTNTTWIGR